MQKLLRWNSILYFTYLLFMIILSIVLSCFDYIFIVSNETIWFVINISVVGVFTALCLPKRKESMKSANIIAQLLPLLALIYIIAISSTDGVDNITLSIHGLICFLSCYVISLLYAKRNMFRVVCVVLNSILLFFLIAHIFLTMTFGQIGKDTIVKQVISPDESYTAVLIDSNQGALGGRTQVNITYNTNKNIGYGQFAKRLYTGGWGEFKTMILIWSDDNTLLINGNAYIIE